MSLWDKVVGIANKAMKTEADQILRELRAECPKDTGKTAKSFKIMDVGSDYQVGTTGRGLTTRVLIASDSRVAYWAEYGNGGPETILTAKHRRADGKTPMLGKYPNGIPGYGWRASVHGYYDPAKQGFVKRVADRHR